MTVSEASTGSAGLNRLQVQKALRIWTIEGCVSTVQMTLTSGAFLTGFALYLGCSDLIIGVAAAIPAFAGLLQLFASYFARRYGSRRLVVPLFAFLSRILWIPALLIPYVCPKPAWVGLFLALILLMSALGNIASPLWTAWMSDLVPPEYRGRYFGQRNMYAGFIGMVASIAAGAFFDTATRRHLLSQPAAFGCLFFVSCLCALWSFRLGRRSPDVPNQESEPNTGSARGRPDALAYYLSPFRDANFARIIGFYCAVSLSINIAGQFFTVYQLSVLKLNYTTFQILAAVASLGSLISMPLWGYLADKYGNKPILHICMVMVLAPPIMWCFTRPDAFPGLWAVGAHGELLFSYSKLDIAALNTIAGLGWAGVGLTQFNIMIGVAPPERRTMYVSVISAVTGIVGGVAPLLGGALLDVLKNASFPQHGLVHNNYHVLFLISAFLRLVSLGVLAKVAEEGSTSARYVLDQIKGTNPIHSIANIQQLSKGSTAVKRQHAAERLARLRTPVAVEELVHALDDVALPVREQAAVALGEIGDKRAIEPLVRKLSDPAAGITSAAASALGKIGSAEAFPALAAAAQLGPTPRRVSALEAIGRMPDARATALLIDLTGDADMSVRTAAVRAVVEREDVAAESPLVKELATEIAPELMAIIADGLGRFGTLISLDALLLLLERKIPETVRRTVINAIGSIVGGRDSLYPYLALDPFARDETVSQILSGIQKRFRLRAGKAARPGAGRIAVRARQALECYVAGDYRRCFSRLRALAGLLSDQCLQDGRRNGAEPPGPSELLMARLRRVHDLRTTNDTRSTHMLAVMDRLHERVHRPELPPIGVDEVLLAVFIVRELTASS